MLDGDLFDKLAQIGSRIRKNPLPFGGIQVHIHIHSPLSHNGAH